MLLELNLRNFILIEDIRLAFGKGLNIVTGETGAGKSIILEGLRICLGSRTSKDYLRDAQEKAIFEMVFATEEDLFTITREIFPSGKALSRLNGEIVNVETIQQSIAPYLDIYGQRDHFMLLDPRHQREVIEGFDPSILPLKADLSESVTHYRATLKAIEDIEQLAKKDIDQERFILEELQRARLDLESDQKLTETFERLQHVADLSGGLQQSLHELEDTLHPLYQSQQHLQELTRFDSGFDTYLNRLDSVRLELEDIRDSLQDSFHRLDLDESELERINERMALLHELQKKHRRDLQELILYQDELQQTIHLHETFAVRRQELIDQKKAQLAQYEQESLRVKDMRQRIFNDLKQGLLETLKKLELKQVALELRDQVQSGEPTEQGMYRSELYASMNAQDLKPLRDVLSGGEMSRFILALKSLFSDKENTLCMVFDEIDTGISGKTAFEVGRMIRDLARSKQVIAITHLPQLAGFADIHYLIEKSGQTTTVTRLSEEQHVERLAVMMSSAVTPTALQGARELIDKARTT